MQQSHLLLPIGFFQFVTGFGKIIALNITSRLLFYSKWLFLSFLPSSLS